MVSLLTRISNKLTFKPNELDHGGLAHIAPLPIERFRFGHEDGLDLDGLFCPGTETTAVLFLHGNRHNLTKFSDHYKLFVSLGVPFMAFDYPGYGKSAGEPSEDSLYQSAQAALTHLTQRIGFAPRNTIVYGCSLGGAVASNLVVSADEKPAGLITEATFTNTRAAGKHLYPYFPLWLFTAKRFCNDERFPHLSLPVFMIHGDNDPIIPLSMAHELHALLPSKKHLAIITGADHTDSLVKGDSDLQEALRSFVRAPASLR
jgi:pimeloyl-ACP methyl ester carboxylesterase